jgi:hypothetical protein
VRATSLPRFLIAPRSPEPGLSIKFLGLLRKKVKVIITAARTVVKNVVLFIK